MKKILALLLVCAMLFSVAACTRNPGAENTSGPEVTGTPVPSAPESSLKPLNIPKVADGKELGKYKIGFYYFPTSDALGAQYRYALDWIAEYTNCEMEYFDMSTWSAEEIATAVESLVSVGCDAVIVMAGSSPAIFEYMNEEGVYYAGLTRSHTPEVAKVADPSEFCCGWLDEGGGGFNFKLGYDMVKTLADSGCQKIVYSSVMGGSEMTDDRMAGMRQAAEDLGVEILGGYQGTDYHGGATDVLSSYGAEIDGMYSNMPGETAIAATVTAGYGGKIKIVQSDLPAAGDICREYLEQGLLTATSAGNNVFVLQLYMQLYNALTGADRLFNEGEKLIPHIPGFVVRGLEEWDMLQKYVVGEIPALLPEELLSLNSHYAPDTTVEEKEAIMKNFSSDEYWNIRAIAERLKPYLG